MTQQRMSDDRLAWLAVRDELRGRPTDRPYVALIVLGTIVAVAAGAALHHLRIALIVAMLGVSAVVAMVRTSRQMLTRRMQEYSFAVLDTTRELNPADRQVLRDTGKVPDWFVERVAQRRRAAGQTSR